MRRKKGREEEMNEFERRTTGERESASERANERREVVRD